MTIWQWFCTLGRGRGHDKRPTFLPTAKEVAEQDGGAMMCTRVCGENGCRCGGTMRGLYCVWSYYRVPAKDEAGDQVKRTG